MALGLGCLFDGGQTAGFACDEDEHCGGGLACIDGICGGDGSGEAGSGSDDDEDSDDGDDSDDADVGSGSPTCDEEPMCIDDASISACIDDELMSVSCSEACGEQPAFGCYPTSSSETCICNSEAPGSCTTPDAIECVGSGGVQICEGTAWAQYDCDAICELDPRGAFANCGFDAESGHDVCYCDIGAPCITGAAYCADPSRLRVCDGGTWLESSCQDLCSTQDLGNAVGCLYRESLGTDTCVCTG